MYRVTTLGILILASGVTGLQSACGDCTTDIEKHSHKHKVMRWKTKSNIVGISAEDLKKEMDTGNPVVINVLGPKTFRDCRIKGSRNIPLSKIEEEMNDPEKWPHNRRIIVYCASYACPASKMAFKKLKKMGFTNIATYEGGMKEWREKQFPRTGRCKEKYLYTSF